MKRSWPFLTILLIVFSFFALFNAFGQNAKFESVENTFGQNVKFGSVETTIPVQRTDDPKIVEIVFDEKVVTPQVGKTVFVKLLNEGEFVFIKSFEQKDRLPEELEYILSSLSSNPNYKRFVSFNGNEIRQINQNGAYLSYGKFPLKASRTNASFDFIKDGNGKENIVVKGAKTPQNDKGKTSYEVFFLPYGSEGQPSGGLIFVGHVQLDE